MENGLDDNSAQLAAEMENLVAKLMLQSDREQVASEIGVLQSIYGDDSIQAWHGSKAESPEESSDGCPSNRTETIRYVVSLNLPSHEDVSIRILVSLPPSYPAESPPQLQLLSRYIGPFGVDSSLFGSVLRTFISEISGIEWPPDTVCVFDGLQSVLERCEAWYEDKLNKEKGGELIQEDTLVRDSAPSELMKTKGDGEGSGSVSESASTLQQNVALPEGIKIVEAEPIVDRKSVFVGRACQISHPSQVPLILNHLMSDRHIARAAHPIINAWRCQVGNVLHQDNDDDGETAAGSRLAHLLSIMELSNVLVVVTRWFGGIHLGPDRFKHINHAARNALEMGGFLDQAEGSKSGAKGRRR